MTNKKYSLPSKTFFSAVSIATVLTIITIAIVNRASITKVAPSQAAGVNDVLSYAGLSNILTDLPTTVVNNATGVYTLQASTCTDPTKDRFEIQLSHRVNHIYGLGTNYTTGAVEVSDFTDTSFASGHDSVSVPTNYVFNGDHGRGRRPVFILPEEHVIIAYLQPSVKILRLTRDASSTVLVLKKNNTYAEGSCAPLVVIKGSTNIEMYKLYNQYLKQRFAFKKPNYNSTGLGWEAWAEYGCNATVTSIRNAYGSFKTAGIPLSFIVDGSGFWNWQTGQANGCSENVGIPDTPTMDALQVSPDRFVSKLEWDRMIADLKAGGVNFMIGMRNSVHPGNAANIENKIRAIAIGGTFMPSTSPVFFNTNPMYGTIPSNNVRILNLPDSSVMNRYLQLLRAAYGNVGGFKEDEMIVGDQKAFTNNINATNLPDDFVSKSYGYYKNLGSDFIIWGPNDWFSTQTDIHNLPGYVPGHVEPYSLPFWIQNALSHSISGYPNVLMESDGNVQLKEGSPIAVQKEFLRDIQANIFMPAVSQSRGFWHLTDPAIKSKHIYFSQLRERLRRYIYDNAVKNYEDGVPSLLKPLFIDSDNTFAQDSNILKLYSDEAFPVKYEYMFGNSLLIRPIVSASDTVSVYFPRGEWANIFTGERFTGPALVNLNFPYDQSTYPSFAKAGEPFILQDVNDTFQNRVRIYPTNTYQTVYSHYNTAGNKVGTVTVNLNKWTGDWSTLRVVNSTGQAVAFTRSIKDELVFNMFDGVSYTVFNQPAATLTPSPSPTPTLSPSPTPTRSPSPTPTRSPSPSPTLSPTPSASPTHSPNPTPTNSASPTPSSSPIAYNCANQSFYSVNSLSYSYSKDCLSVPNIMYRNENRFNIFLTPNIVKNIPYIKTENLGIKEDQNLHWSITSQISANLFVMYRKIPGQTPPAWLSQSYTKLTNDDYSNLQQFLLRKNELGLIGVYDIYVKPVQAHGTINLGPASDATVTAYSMYLVGLNPGL